MDVLGAILLRFARGDCGGADAGRRAGGFGVFRHHAGGVGLGKRARLHTLTGHSGYISAVSVTPDGQRGVSASYDNTVRV